jgi:hypothetical protein
MTWFGVGACPISRALLSPDAIAPSSGRPIAMTTRLTAFVLVSSVALVGCGGDDDESGSSTQPSVDTGEISTVATTSAAGDESPGSTAASTTAPATDPPTASSPASGPSHCAVTVTGDVTAEWTSEASGFGAFVYGGWLDNPSPEDASAFGVNCYDTDVNIVGFTASPFTEIPMEPATYELTGDPGTPISTDMALLSDEGSWELTSGTLEILEFDDRHIRATFSLAMQDSFDPARTAEVTGEFAHSR